MLPRLLCLVLVLTGVTLSVSAAVNVTARQRVLVFTKSSGFEHDAISKGKPPAA